MVWVQQQTCLQAYRFLVKLLQQLLEVSLQWLVQNLLLPTKVISNDYMVNSFGDNIWNTNNIEIILKKTMLTIVA